MCGEGTGCVGVAGTVPAAGSEGACTCWEVASGDGGGGEALRRAALGVGRRARGHASGKAAVGVGGGEGGGVVAGGGERLRCGGICTSNTATALCSLLLLKHKFSGGEDVGQWAGMANTCGAVAGPCRPGPVAAGRTTVSKNLKLTKRGKCYLVLNNAFSYPDTATVCR